MKAKTLLLMLLSFCAWTTETVYSDEITAVTGASWKQPAEVTTAELEELIASGEIILIDARPAPQQVLPGAVVLSGNPSAEEAARAIEFKDSAVVVYCANPGSRLRRKLKKHLEALGYTDIREYPAGFDGWHASGRPVVPHQ